MSTAEAFALEKVSFSQLEGWGDDDPRPLFAAMASCLSYIGTVKPYRTGSLGLSAGQDLAPFLEEAKGQIFADASEARRFFEAHCQPFRIRRDSGAAGFVTAFYEPDVDVSAVRDSDYQFPFYRRPLDLIDINGDNRPAGMDASYAFAREQNGLIDTYPDRRAIDLGYLEDQGLEIAWAGSKVDVFYAHVQGAARLRYPDGRTGRITYAAKAGHPFSAIGRLLIDRGEIDAKTVSMQSVRQWLAENPAKVDEVLWHNRSYIFFREAEVPEGDLGPIAAAKVPLVPGRALAVDRLVHTFGFPFFIRSETLTHLDNGRPFSRLMLALDTGSAIVGPARGDIFTGSGFHAGELAGTVRHPADFYILIPNAAAARYGQ